MRVDEDEAPRCGPADGDEETRILFLVDQNVFRRVRPQPVSEDLRRAVVLVQTHVEQVLAVFGPDHRATRVGNDPFRIPSGFQIPDVQVVVFRAAQIGAPGEPAMIRGMLRRTEAEEAVSLRLFLRIEQDRLLASLARHAHDARMLRPFDVAEGVGPGAVGHRHGTVVLADPPLHFRKQRLLQLRGIGHVRLLPGVFRLQIGADVSRQSVGILHDFLPVVGTQPCVVIDALDAVMDGFHRALFGPGRAEIAHVITHLFHPVGNPGRDR